MQTIQLVSESFESLAMVLSAVFTSVLILSGIAAVVIVNRISK